MATPEAYWRMYGYKITDMSHIVQKLLVHGEKGQGMVFEEGDEAEVFARAAQEQRPDSMLIAYFKKCDDAAHEAEMLAKYPPGVAGSQPRASELLYEDFPIYYYFNARDRQWHRRIRLSLEAQLAASDDPRARIHAGRPRLTRIYAVSPKNRELFAIRSLLLVSPGAKSFKDLRTHDGVEHLTFEAAAQAKGIMESPAAYINACDEAAVQNTSTRGFRLYFANLLVHGIPPNPLELFERYLDHITPPRYPGSPGRREPREVQRQRGLAYMEYLLSQMGSCNA